MTEQNLYKTAEAAELFGVCRLTIIRWIEAGKIKAMKAGRQWRITAAEIERRKQEIKRG